MPVMTTQMIVRIDPDLKAKVNNFAKAEGKNVSEVVRELLEDYVKSRDINAYIDDLWDRIGGKLESKGFGRKDITRVIREVRAKH
jgi:predicted DNA-binding protein